MRVEGNGIYVDSSGKSRSINGVEDIAENDTIENLKVFGSLTFNKIFVNEMKIEGEVIGESVNAKNITVHGDFNIGSTNVEKIFKVVGAVKINTLNAEQIFIESRNGSIDEVKCNTIKIFHQDYTGDDNILFGILGGKSRKNTRVKIRKIVAENVELKNCEAEEVVCKKAFIDSNCDIKKLIADEYEVSADSRVSI